MYTSVNDIDLWVGGLSEKPVPGGMVGETFATILKDQFERVRDGDRYWYQNRDLDSMQLMMIENTSLSDIIMRNTDMYMDHSAFLAADVPVGGKIIPIDSTSLLLAGIQTSAVWIVPLLAGVVGIAIIFIKKKRN